MAGEPDRIIRQMEPLLKRLKCSPLRNMSQLHDLPGHPFPKQGIYVFYEQGKPLYVGCSDGLGTRILQHRSSDPNKAAFAFILTRDEWRLWKNPIWERDLYKKDKELVEIRNSKGEQTKVKLSKGAMLDDKSIKQDFQLQRERIKEMQVRVIEIEDEYEQAMFEIYAAYVLSTPYNTFKTT